MRTTGHPITRPIAQLRGGATLLLLLLAAGVLAAALTVLHRSGPIHGIVISTDAPPAAVEPERDPPGQDPPGQASGPFTMEELMAGDVTATRFNAFWRAQVERIQTAPCAARPPGGATIVVFSLGATPPEDLGPDYVDWAPVLTAARAAAEAACA